MLWCVFTVVCDIARFLCAMRVFKVRASSSSPRPPLCQISFPSRPPWLSQPIEKNMHYWRSQRGEGRCHGSLWHELLRPNTQKLRIYIHAFLSYKTISLQAPTLHLDHSMSESTKFYSTKSNVEKYRIIADGFQTTQRQHLICLRERLSQLS